MLNERKVLLSAPLLYTLRPRLPLPRTTSPRPISLSFLSSPLFWSLSIGNTLQSLGYFLPSAYLPTYTSTTLSLPPTLTTLLLSLLNTTSIPGGILLGALSDRSGPIPTILISSLGSAAAVFFLWGFASRLDVLVAFALVYGFFAGGFSSTWSGVVKEVGENCEGVETGLLFGLLAGGRGVGNVVSGPLSGGLVREGGLMGGRAGVGGEYGGVILWTGVTAVLGGWGVVGRWWR